MRLAREVAHTTDVDGMLASMTPEQMDEWMVAYKIWSETEAGDTPQTAEDQISELNKMRMLTGV